MQDLKLKLATFITADGVTESVETMAEMWHALNIPDTDEYTEARVSIVQKLLAFHEVDLSPAYPGHNVVVRIEWKED